jgi:hypothetical protein
MVNIEVGRENHYINWTVQREYYWMPKYVKKPVSQY